MRWSPREDLVAILNKIPDNSFERYNGLEKKVYPVDGFQVTASPIIFEGAEFELTIEFNLAPGLAVETPEKALPGKNSKHLYPYVIDEAWLKPLYPSDAAVFKRLPAVRKSVVDQATALKQAGVVKGTVRSGGSFDKVAGHTIDLKDSDEHIYKSFLNALVDNEGRPVYDFWVHAQAGYGPKGSGRIQKLKDIYRRHAAARLLK